MRNRGQRLVVSSSSRDGGRLVRKAAPDVVKARRVPVAAVQAVTAGPEGISPKRQGRHAPSGETEPLPLGVALRAVLDLESLGVSRDAAVAAVASVSTEAVLDTWTFVVLEAFDAWRSRAQATPAETTPREGRGGVRFSAVPAWRSPDGKSRRVPQGVKDYIVGQVRSGVSQVAMARRFNIAQSTVSRLVSDADYHDKLALGAA